MFQDGRDDLRLPAAALRAVPQVDVEDALEQPRPADALRLGVHRLDIALGSGCVLGGLCCLRGRRVRHHGRPQFGVGGPHAMEPEEAQPWSWDQCREPLHALRRASQARGAGAPGSLQAEHQLTRGVESHPVVGQRRPGRSGPRLASARRGA
jgi:hypothetical protein